MPHDGQDMLAGIRLPASLEPGLRQELEAAARTVQVPAGTVVFHPGDEMETFLVVGEGSLRVYKASSEGREITLEPMPVFAELLADLADPALRHAESLSRSTRRLFLCWQYGLSTSRQLSLPPAFLPSLVWRTRNLANALG